MMDKNEILEEASQLGLRPYKDRPSAKPKPSSLNKVKPEPKPEVPEKKADDRILMKKIFGLTSDEVDDVLINRDKHNPSRVFNKEEIQEIVSTDGQLYDYPLS